MTAGRNGTVRATDTEARGSSFAGPLPPGDWTAWTGLAGAGQGMGADRSADRAPPLTSCAHVGLAADSSGPATFSRATNAWRQRPGYLLARPRRRTGTVAAQACFEVAGVLWVVSLVLAVRAKSWGIAAIIAVLLAVNAGVDPASVRSNRPRRRDR